VKWEIKKAEEKISEEYNNDKTGKSRFILFPVLLIEIIAEIW